MLEIRLLGPLEVRDDDRILDLRRRKQRALLAALALRVDGAVSPDRLVEDLWGADAPKTARHALENYVSDLRKVLGRDVIRTVAAGYALDLAPDHVDASRFERLLAEARGRPASERAETYRAALSLVRGQPLEDLAYEPFAQTAVPRLSELELVAREGLAEAELELGRHADVVLSLEPLVAEYPYRERLRAQLMLALYRSGRQADALAAYQDGRRILVEELGIDPGDELQELERAILRQDHALRAPAREPAERDELRREDLASRPVRKTVVVLVAELANVTALATALDPEPLRALLDRCRAACRTAIEAHGGVSRQHDAERILAVFGFPATHEDDALRAVRAAADLRVAVGELNDGLFSEHGLFLEIREGVTCGEVLVTPQGSELATGLAASAAVALARRARGGQILVDEAVRDRLGAAASVEPVEPGLSGEPAEHGGAGASTAYRLVELSPDASGRVLRLESPLVGRRRQLATLANAFETAIAGQSLQLLTVLGEAGAGKSRLVREFADGVGDIGSLAWCRCLPYGERSALWPLIDGLGLDDADGGGPSAADVRAALESAAHARPLMLVLDDLHWAEPPLLELVDQIADLSRGVPALVLCSARPELLEQVPSWGGGKPNASSMLLEPLTESESERLIDNLLGDADLPDAIRDYVIRTADGNPLFVEELLATLVDQNVLTREAGRWTTTTTAAVPVPPTIQALIASRIDRLPDRERVVLELASVGRERTFSRLVIAELAPPAVAESVPEALAALVRKELVRPEPGDPDRLAFRHQLIRDAAYRSLPLGTRAELHDRLAELAETSGARGAEASDHAAHHRELARRYRERLAPASPAETSDPS